MYCLGLIFYDWKGTLTREKEKRISNWSWSEWEQKELDKDHRLVLNAEGLSVPWNCDAGAGAFDSAEIPSLRVGIKRHSALHPQGSAEGTISIRILSFLLWSTWQLSSMGSFFGLVALDPWSRDPSLMTAAITVMSGHWSLLLTRQGLLKPYHTWGIQVFTFYRAPDATHSLWVLRKLRLFF